MLIGTIKEIWRYPVKSMAGESLDQSLVAQLGIPGDRGWALRDEQTGEITNGKRIPLLMQCAASYRHPPTLKSVSHVDIVLPNGTSTSTDDPRINSRLSEILGRAVTLWPLQPANSRKHYRRNTASARLFGPLSRFRTFRSLLPEISKLPNIDAALREVFGREAGEPVPDISLLPPEVLEFTSPPGTYFDAFPLHLLTTTSLETMKRRNPAALWDVRRFRPNFFVQTIEGVEGLVESSWSGRTLQLGTVKVKCEIPTVRCGMTTHAQAALSKDPSILRSIVKDADQNLGIYASIVIAGRVGRGDPVELS